jgi:hypothetical protein
MRFPVSNVVTSSIRDQWHRVWTQPQFITPSDGYSFSDFTIEDVFPWSKYISTEYELKWDGFASWALHFRETWNFCVMVALMYLLCIPLGQRLMSNRNAFELKYPLFLWNLGLAIFSILGVLHVVPSFLYGMAINGPLYYVCRNGHVGFGRGPLGFWCVMFVLSKYAELVDTAFLVLRKKPVPFLHWFHHASVLLISVGSIMISGPTGMIMIAMNYFVHSIMYSYYAIAAITRPPRWGKTVTVLQISQMVGGILMCGGIYFAYKTVDNCEVQPANAFGILFIYSSYLILFVRFYISRYLVGRKPLEASLKKSE